MKTEKNIDKMSEGMRRKKQKGGKTRTQRRRRIKK